MISLKKIVLYFILVTSVFASKLVDGRYSVTENVIRGKKWRSIVVLDVKNHKVRQIKYDMTTKDGEFLSQSNEIERIVKEAKGINPYEKLPKEYLKKIRKNSNPNLATIDIIAGATAKTSKFNKMMLFLMKKSGEGKIGEYKGWFR